MPDRYLNRYFALEAEIAARQEIWRNFKQSKEEAGDDEVVVLSSDDEENERKPEECKRSYEF